jgi:hypothetical protein
LSHPKTKLSGVGGVYYSMRTQTTKYDESRIAEEIVSVLPAGVARACSPQRDAIRYTVRAAGMKLETIVLKRSSLRRLIDDPARDIKIEYLKRDLLQSASRRGEFRYPRLSFRTAAAVAAALANRTAANLRFASL